MKIKSIDKILNEQPIIVDDVILGTLRFHPSSVEIESDDDLQNVETRYVFNLNVYAGAGLNENISFYIPTKNQFDKYMKMSIYYKYYNGIHSKLEHCVINRSDITSSTNFLHQMTDIAYTVIKNLYTE